MRALIIALLVSTGSVVEADVVHLLNGDTIEGNIEAVSPGEWYRMFLSDGSLKVIQAEQVDWIEYSEMATSALSRQQPSDDWRELSVPGDTRGLHAGISVSYVYPTGGLKPLANSGPGFALIGLYGLGSGHIALRVSLEYANFTGANYRGQVVGDPVATMGVRLWGAVEGQVKPHVDLWVAKHGFR